jgi:hypothetical protein
MPSGNPAIGPTDERCRAARVLPFLAALLLALPVGTARGELLDSEKTAAEWITPKTHRAIDRGLEFLAARQNEEDGSFGSESYRGNVAVSALVAMAFMSGGSTPGRGPYGENVDACVGYLLGRVEAGGLIAEQPQVSRRLMYGHGFATLLLAQCHGMSKRPELRPKLTQAVRLIVHSQNDEGGWRYDPVPREADLSVTVCQVMALRAARDAGLYVPRQTIDRAVAYVKQCQNTDGGFTYMLQPREESQFARSAAALVALYSAGIYQGSEIEEAIRYLEPFTPGRVRERPDHYYYGHYYAAHGMWYAGGSHWQEWYPAIRDELVGQQRNDGSWESDISVEYATAMACIILQVPNGCLPILQR